MSCQATGTKEETTKDRDDSYDRIIPIANIGQFQSLDVKYYNDQIKKKHLENEKTVAANYKLEVKGSLITTVCITKYTKLPNIIQGVDFTQNTVESVSVISLFFYWWQNDLQIEPISNLNELIEKTKFDEIPHTFVLSLPNMLHEMVGCLILTKFIPESYINLLYPKLTEFIVDTVIELQKSKDPSAENVCKKSTIRKKAEIVLASFPISSSMTNVGCKLIRTLFEKEERVNLAKIADFMIENNLKVKDYEDFLREKFKLSEKDIKYLDCKEKIALHKIPLDLAVIMYPEFFN
ncbi:MAG: hypothetical protein LBP31_02995, partial [Holosporales bacterium]|nr:hypothetical protein [Holosporales bacterium]